MPNDFFSAYSGEKPANRFAPIRGRFSSPVTLHPWLAPSATWTAVGDGLGSSTDSFSAGAPLSIKTTRPDPVTVRIDVGGELDLATAPRLRSALLSALAAPVTATAVQVDLARVTFMDARGIAVLVEGGAAARRTGVDFSVHNPCGMVVRLLDMLGLTDTLRVVPAAPPS